MKNSCKIGINSENAKMIKRIHRALVQKRLTQFPAVAILGPRQCGKTTLANGLKGIHFDLEQEGHALRLDAQWEGLTGGKELLILDEAQSRPEIFPRLRNSIDKKRPKKGRFLLLGSVSPSLVRSISESLAGRLCLIELSPFVLPELNKKRIDDLWLYGGFPDGGILDKSMFGPWQESYLNLVLHRDLPNWGLSAQPKVMERLVRMIGALQAQILNMSKLASSLALDGKTVTKYCDFLEGAFLIRRLQPFLPNIRKRLIKRPKVYWRDSGLVHYILGVKSIEQLFSQPWVGSSWEGFIIEQTMAVLRAVGNDTRAFFFRTSDGFELDMVLDFGSSLWAVEIKLTTNPSTQQIERLKKTAAMIGADRCVFICRTPKEIEGLGLLVTNAAAWLDRLTKL